MMIFKADHIHSRNTRIMNLCEFIGCLSISFFGMTLLFNFCNETIEVRNILSLLFVSFPTIIFRYIVFIIVTIPCLIHDNSKVGLKDQEKHLKQLKLLIYIHIFGYFFCMVSSILFFSIGFWALHMFGSCGDEDIAFWMFSLCQCNSDDIYIYMDMDISMLFYFFNVHTHDII